MKQELLLSEAIILGSGMKKQIKYKFDDGKGGACPVGMAAAAGCPIFQISKRWSFRSAELTHWVWNKAVELPCNCGLADRLAIFAIAHLNDAHEWTPTQIAEWVASIEKKLGLVQPHVPIENFSPATLAMATP